MISIVILLAITRVALTDDDSEDDDDDKVGLEVPFERLETVDTEICSAVATLDPNDRDSLLKKLKIYVYFLRSVFSALKTGSCSEHYFQKSKQLIDNSGPRFVKIQWDVFEYFRFHGYTKSEQADMAQQWYSVEVLLQNIEKVVYQKSTARPVGNVRNGTGDELHHHNHHQHCDH